MSNLGEGIEERAIEKATERTREKILMLSKCQKDRVHRKFS